MSEITFSSKSTEWETPQDLFDRLNYVYGFTLDAAASAENTKCDRYYTKENSGLTKDWGGEKVWLNPPYGRGLDKWVAKAYQESRKPRTLVVALLPVRTHTAWYHEYCTRGQITFLRGRLKFGDSKYDAPFPSMVVVWGMTNGCTYQGLK